MSLNFPLKEENARKLEARPRCGKAALRMDEESVLPIFLSRNDLPIGKYSTPSLRVGRSPIHVVREGSIEINSKGWEFNGLAVINIA